jgi:hypothetical protein
MEYLARFESIEAIQIGVGLLRHDSCDKSKHKGVSNDLTSPTMSELTLKRGNSAAYSPLGSVTDGSQRTSPFGTNLTRFEEPHELSYTFFTYSNAAPALRGEYISTGRER